MYDYERKSWKKRAMSLAEAKAVLGFPLSANPTDLDINRAYRNKYIENRKMHPDTGGDAALATQLNVAKDTLQGKLRPDRGTPGYNPPADPREEDEARKRHEEYERKKSKPVPKAPGAPSVSAALPSGVDWKVLSSASYSSSWERDAEGDLYQSVTRYSVAFGKTSNGYVAAQIKAVTHNRGSGSKESSTGYTVVTMPLSAGTALLKAAPKIIKGMMPQDWSRSLKFRVIEGGFSDKSLNGSFTLSFKDAALGSELVDPSQDSSLKGRVIQVEVEPVLNREKMKAWKDDPNRDRSATHLIYDWYLYVNGKKSQLTEKEVRALLESHFLFSVYGYDYDKGRKNISKLRGGAMSFGAVDALKALAKGLKPGPVRSAVEQAAEQAASKRKRATHMTEASEGEESPRMGYDRRTIRKKWADAGNPDLPTLARLYYRVVANLSENEEKIKQDPEDFGNRINAGASVRVAFSLVKRYGIELLFFGILQEYKLATKDRKVIEGAARQFSKGSMRRIDPKKAADVYQKALKDYRAIEDVVKRTLERGTKHEDVGEEGGSTLKAGPFTLINAGGFDTKQLQEVQKVVEKAASLLKAKGLGKVCYGNIQVTNTVGRSANVLAFYLINTDEMFVRGNLRGKQGLALHTVLHELGHRLHLKFLKSNDSGIKAIYNTLAGKQDSAMDAALADKSNWPKPGTVIKEGRRLYIVEDVTFSPKSLAYVVNLRRDDNPQRKAVMPLKAWVRSKGLTTSFISDYASKSPEENFAEMLSHYCQGTLPEELEALLEPVLG